MNQAQSDLLKATAKSMRKAARGIDRLCTLLAPDYYDDGAPGEYGADAQVIPPSTLAPPQELGVYGNTDKYGGDPDDDPTPNAMTQEAIREARDGHTKAYVTLDELDAELETETCEWYEDMDGIWRGSCGITWQMETGTPTENEMAYCPKCGHPLIAHYTETEDARTRNAISRAVQEIEP